MVGNCLDCCGDHHDFIAHIIASVEIRGDFYGDSIPRDNEETQHHRHLLLFLHRFFSVHHDGVAYRATTLRQKSRDES